MEKLHHIIIAGGGAAGLELATLLGRKLGRRKLAEITLIDASRTHIWKPLLHEIAAGTLDSSEDELEYLAQARWNNFRYRLGRVVGLDRKRREVLLAPTLDDKGEGIISERRFGYDTLVFVVGSLSNDFGIPGVQEHCLFLDSTEQAERFQQNLLNSMLRAHTQAKPIKQGQLVVKRSLQCTRDEDIFAIGDCAACPMDDMGNNVPPRAQAAHQQALTLFKTLVRRIRGRPPLAYTYRDFGSLVAMGKYSTVGNLMGGLAGSMMISGSVARLIYLMLYKMHQATLYGWSRAVLISLLHFLRKGIDPQVKLH